MPKIVHFEMHVDDPSRAEKFYSEVFGWKFTRWDGPQEYWMISTGEEKEQGIEAGMMRRRDPGASTYCSIAVDNIEAFEKKVIASGGEIVVPKMPIQGVGWLFHFKDPEGNILGVAEFDPNAK